MQVRERQRDGGVVPAPPAPGGDHEEKDQSANRCGRHFRAILRCARPRDAERHERWSVQPSRRPTSFGGRGGDVRLHDHGALATPAGREWDRRLVGRPVLPHEVTSRLAVQDPTQAKVVEAAWADLRSVPASELRRAVRWIDGLATGLILTHEITSRLAVQDRRLARVVQAAWSDLAPVAGRGAGW